MNLSVYDDTSNRLDRQKTWVCPIRKLLYSREIKYRKYYIIGKRFDKYHNDTNYYAIMLDEPPVDRKAETTHVDELGRIKLNIKSIWNSSNLKQIETKQNIEIEHVDQTDDGDVYYLDV
jgi:hypothetical protein